MKKTLLILFFVFNINTIYSQLSATSAIINPSCAGNGIGSVIINATGGAIPYQYSIDGTTYQSSNTFAGLQAGTYTIIVLDSNSQTVNVTFSITAPAPLQVFLAGTLDVPQSTVMSQVFEGTPPYSYQWSLDGATIVGVTSDFINVLSMPQGNLCVIVSDSNGCTSTACLQIQGSSINAQDDNIQVALTNSISTSTNSVLTNDTVNGISLNFPQYLANTTLTPLTIPTGFQLNPNGTISVLPGISSGTYTISYQVCYGGVSVCDTANATITVINEGFSLNAFVDSNGNSIQDANEQNFSLGTFNYIMNNNGVVNSISSSYGSAVLSESNVSNNYNFSLEIPTQYQSQYSCSTIFSNVAITAGNVTTYKFPVTELPFTDLRINIFSNGTPPRPGFSYMNKIVYKNLGNQNIPSGTITFTKDSNVAIISTSEITIPTASGFTYNFTNLVSNEAREIIVTMQVPTIPTVSLGQLVTNTVSITIPAGDIIVDNNNSSLSQTIVGSYDPNDKSESHGGKIVHAQFTSNDYLTYTIQFENTGTYEATNVRVEDFLDSKLNPSTLRMVSSSANYTIKKVGNQLTWNFNGINLPPSNGSTTIGHGYITFQIKPTSDYSIGDIIPNIAKIYFDFNPAIITPTCTTEFVTSLSNEFFVFNNLNFYPNPVENTLTISNDTIIDEIQIHSITGQIIYKKHINNLATELDLSNLKSGIYFVNVLSNEAEKTLKIIKK